MQGRVATGAVEPLASFQQGSRKVRTGVAAVEPGAACAVCAMHVGAVGGRGEAVRCGVGNRGAGADVDRGSDRVRRRAPRGRSTRRSGGRPGPVRTAAGAEATASETRGPVAAPRRIGFAPRGRSARAAQAVRAVQARRRGARRQGEKAAVSQAGGGSGSTSGSSRSGGTSSGVRRSSAAWIS